MGKNLLETIAKGDGTSFVTVTVAPDASKDERKKGNSVVAKLTNGMRQVLRESWPRFVVVPCVRRVLAVRSPCVRFVFRNVQSPVRLPCVCRRGPRDAGHDEFGINRAQYVAYLTYSRQRSNWRRVLSRRAEN